MRRFSLHRLLGLVFSAGLLLAGAFCKQQDAPAKKHTIDIRDLKFAPEQLVVAAKDTIVWKNHDLVPHTVTAERGHWNSEQIIEGASWLLVTKDPGPYAYYCAFHPDMKGLIVIR